MKAVQEKIYSILSSDATLAALLGATASDSHIYPQIVNKLEVFPCITYEVVDEMTLNPPLNKQVIIMQFNIYTKETGNGSNPRDKLESIYSKLYSVLNYIKGQNPIIYAIQRGGMYDDQTDRQLFSKAIRFEIWAYNN
jgi:hypothetical protein